MKKPTAVILFFSAIYCILLFLSLYGGFSEKADMFCTGPFMFESTGIGPSGKVVMWLRVFSIFLIVCLGLFSILLIFANMTFNSEDYDEKQNNIHDEQQAKHEKEWELTLINIVYEPETSGCLAIDALKVYESYSINIFYCYIGSLLFCWVSWIVWGIVVLSLYVPIECSRHRIGDNTSYVMMYIVVVIAWLPFVLTFR